MVLERDFQPFAIKEIKKRFDPCWLLKNDTSYQQGIPDWTLFVGSWWGWLEIKKSKDAPFEPNQEWFICEGSRMSFGAVIYPENLEEVLNAIQRSLEVQRTARLLVESFHATLDQV